MSIISEITSCNVLYKLAKH